MKWNDIEQKQINEWKEFKDMQQAAWDKITKDKEAMYESFENKGEQIPANDHLRVDEQRQQWMAEWGRDGQREQELKEAHKQERQTFKQAFKSDNLSKMRNTKEEKDKDRNNDRER